LRCGEIECLEMQGAYRCGALLAAIAVKAISY
jgi:hypothetical protein